MLVKRTAVSYNWLFVSPNTIEKPVAPDFIFENQNRKRLYGTTANLTVFLLRVKNLGGWIRVIVFESHMGSTF